MKTFLRCITTAVVLSSTISCYTEKKVYNRAVNTEKYGKMLLGRQMKPQLLTEPFNEWYGSEYNEYEYDKDIIKQLQKNKINTYNISVFFGTWCKDTHRELPRLIKILDATRYPDKKLTLIGLNRKIESPDGEDVPHNIKKVPTIIVKKYGKEIGRIIETTKSGSIEQDLLDIIKKKK